MSNERAQHFADALIAFEQEGDLDRLLDCFAEDCEVSNVASPRRFEGKEGARRFWSEYRGVLSEVRSRFRNIIEAQDRAALEWVTEGMASTGERISYEGTSVLEFDGEKVKRFYAYFDPHRLGMALTGGTGRLGGKSERSQSAVEGP